MITCVCGFRENLSDAKWCGGCGQPLVFLEVRFGQVVPNYSSFVVPRITNASNAIASIVFSAECLALGLKGERSIRAELDPNASIDLHEISFLAVPGSHRIKFLVDINIERFFGACDLHVRDQQQNLVVHSPAIQNRGEYLIGDHTVEMNVNLSQHVETDPGFTKVPLSKPNYQDILRKRCHANANIGIIPLTSRLTLQFKDATHARQIVLFGGQNISLGRGSDVDLQLLCSTEDDPKERNSEVISREHATLEFAQQGVKWIDQSTVGTEFRSRNGTTRYVKQAESSLASVQRLSPGGVLPLCVYSLEHQVHDLSPYEDFVERELNKKWSPAIGSIQAIRLTREDSWSTQEEYILLQHSVAIGCGDGCGIHIDAPSIELRHAWIHYLGGLFWLEPVADKSVVLHNDEQVVRHRLAPLRAFSHIQLGDIVVVVAPYAQKQRS